MIQSQNQNIHFCQLCQMLTQFCCPFCHKVFYCTQQHQKKDWNNHKNLCFLQDEYTNHTSEPSPKDQYNLKLVKYSLKSNKNQTQTKTKLSKQFINFKVKNLKQLLKLRDDQRKNVLYNYFSGKYTNSIILVRKLILISQKIAFQVQDQVFLEYQNRTGKLINRYLQNYQLLSQYVIYCKIYKKIQNKTELRKILNLLNFPDFRKHQSINLKHKSKEEIIEFNAWRQQISVYLSILKQFILIATSVQLINQSENIYLKYINLIKQTSSEIQLATAYFQFANMFLKFKNNKKAQNYFILCLNIRQKYGISQALADVMMNLGLLQYLSSDKNKKQAIQLVQDSLRIRKDLKQIYSNEQYLNLTSALQTLGKFYMQTGNFHKSFYNLKECYNIRKNKLSQNNKQKKRTQVLILFLYNTIIRRRQIVVITQEKANLEKLQKRIQKYIFGQVDFQKYKKNQGDIKTESLRIVFNERFFNTLKIQQIRQLQLINQKLQAISKNKGIDFFKSTFFYKNLNQLQKLQLFDANPQLQTFNQMLNEK